MMKRLFFLFCFFLCIVQISFASVNTLKHNAFVFSTGVQIEDNVDPLLPIPVPLTVSNDKYFGYVAAFGSDLITIGTINITHESENYDEVNLFLGDLYATNLLVPTYNRFLGVRGVFREPGDFLSYLENADNELGKTVEDTFDGYPANYNITGANDTEIAAQEENALFLNGYSFLQVGKSLYGSSLWVKADLEAEEGLVSLEAYTSVGFDLKPANATPMSFNADTVEGVYLGPNRDIRVIPPEVSSTDDLVSGGCVGFFLDADTDCDTEGAVINGDLIVDNVYANLGSIDFDTFNFSDKVLPEDLHPWSPEAYLLKDELLRVTYNFTESRDRIRTAVMGYLNVHWDNNEGGALQFWMEVTANNTVNKSEFCSGNLGFHKTNKAGFDFDNTNQEDANLAFYTVIDTDTVAVNDELLAGICIRPMIAQDSSAINVWSDEHLDAYIDEQATSVMSNTAKELLKDALSAYDDTYFYNIAVSADDDTFAGNGASKSSYFEKVTTWSMWITTNAVFKDNEPYIDHDFFDSYGNSSGDEGVSLFNSSGSQSGVNYSSVYEDDWAILITDLITNHWTNIEHPHVFMGSTTYPSSGPATFTYEGDSPDGTKWLDTFSDSSQSYVDETGDVRWWFTYSYEYNGYALRFGTNGVLESTPAFANKHYYYDESYSIYLQYYDANGLTNQSGWTNLRGSTSASSSDTENPSLGDMYPSWSGANFRDDCDGSDHLQGSDNEFADNWKEFALGVPGFSDDSIFSDHDASLNESYTRVQAGHLGWDTSGHESMTFSQLNLSLYQCYPEWQAVASDLLWFIGNTDTAQYNTSNDYWDSYDTTTLLDGGGGQNAITDTILYKILDEFEKAEEAHTYKDFSFANAFGTSDYSGYEHIMIFFDQAHVDMSPYIENDLMTDFYNFIIDPYDNLTSVDSTIYDYGHDLTDYHSFSIPTPESIGMPDLQATFTLSGYGDVVINHYDLIYLLDYLDNFTPHSSGNYPIPDIRRVSGIQFESNFTPERNTGGTQYSMSGSASLMKYAIPNADSQTDPRNSFYIYDYKNVPTHRYPYPSGSSVDLTDSTRVETDVLTEAKNEI